MFECMCVYLDFCFVAIDASGDESWFAFCRSLNLRLLNPRFFFGSFEDIKSRLLFLGLLFESNLFCFVLSYSLSCFWIYERSYKKGRWNRDFTSSMQCVFVSTKHKSCGVSLDVRQTSLVLRSITINATFEPTRIK